MKQIIFFLAIAIWVVSCDKIEKPYKIGKIEVSGVDTPSFPDLENVIQKYLFEDYTGHLCTNCPKGGAVLKSLKETMKDTLVLMAVHAGVERYVKPDPAEQGCSNGYTADYRTSVGSEYAHEFKVDANPSGMINRKVFEGNRVLVSATNWASKMNTIPRNPPTMGIQIIPVHQGDTAYIFLKTTLLSDVSGRLRLCAVLVESGIVSPQKNGDPNVGLIPNICDYEHNHLLRASVTSTWGDVLELSKKEDAEIKAYALLFTGKSWKKENCHIIAYIYDDDTKEILQVEEVELIEK